MQFLAEGYARMGRILENIFYLELKRRYRAVYVGRSGKCEVDFVCLDSQSDPSYFLVALQTLDERILNRELRSLEMINDDYPKMLLTFDVINKTDSFNGIIKKDALDWLMKKNNLRFAGSLHRIRRLSSP